MMQSPIRWNIVFAAIYVFLFAFSLYFMFEVAAQDAFAGLFAVTLSLPWSLLLIPAVLTVPSAFDSIVSGTIIVCLILCLGALLTTLLFIYGGAWIRALSRNKNNT